MNLSATAPPRTATGDQDLAEQARPGHGVPSQDSNAAAQLPLEPKEAEREANSAIEGSGQRTHRAVPHSQRVTVNGAPHGLNVSHAQASNDALLRFPRA